MMNNHKFNIFNNLKFSTIHNNFKRDINHQYNKLHKDHKLHCHLVDSRVNRDLLNWFNLKINQKEEMTEILWKDCLIEIKKIEQ